MNQLKSELHHHPLLLIGCYLNPVFYELEFIPDLSMRADFRSKAEELARKLSRKCQMKEKLTAPLREPSTLTKTLAIHRVVTVILDKMGPFLTGALIHRAQLLYYPIAWAGGGGCSIL